MTPNAFAGSRTRRKIILIILLLITISFVGIGSAANTLPVVTTQPQSQTIVYGSNALFTAAASGTPAPTIKWQLSTDSGTTWSNISGATSGTLTVTKPPVSYTGYQYRAVFTNIVGSATSNAVTLTVIPKAASVTPAAKTKVYGAGDPALTGTLTGFVAADGVTATYSRTPGEAAGTYIISATLSPAGVLGNYTITYNTATFTITKKAASVTSNAATKGYGSSDPAFTGSLSGFLASDNIVATYYRTPGEGVGSYTINATLSPGSALGN